MERAKTLENPLNSTQSTSETGNPQAAIPADGASNAADFQSTAPYEALNQQAEELAVQQTGIQAETVEKGTSSNNAPLFWGAGILIVVIAVWLTVRLIREAMDDDKATPAAPAKRTAAATKKAPVKKTTAKKKSAPNQRRKKSATTRRK